MTIPAKTHWAFFAVAAAGKAQDRHPAGHRVRRNANGPRKIATAVVQQKAEEEEEDFSEWENKGAAVPSPLPDIGCLHGAQVARRRSPILRMRGTYRPEPRKP